MAVTLSTTLASAALATDRTIRLTSATGAALGMRVKMEQEWSTVGEINGVVITLGMRGLEGGIAEPHKALSTVQIGWASEFTGSVPTGSDIPIPFSTPQVTFYGAAGAIAVPDQDAKIFLNGAAANAMTLVAPGTDIDGRELIIMAAAAQAYTITVPTSTGIKNTTGTATFGGAIGDTVTLVACKGQWNPANVINVTFA